MLFSTFLSGGAYPHATLNITAFYIEGKTTNANSDELLGMNLAKNVGSAVLNLTAHAPYLLAKKKVNVTEKFIKKKKLNLKSFIEFGTNALKSVLQRCF